MENAEWKKVLYTTRYDELPDKRWGHASCLVDDELIVFGGFANSIFMNDLWTFHIQTMRWTKVETFGQKPKECSNATIHYDPSMGKLIVFGGGGVNKARFNTVYILNWSSKHWDKLPNKVDMPCPCQRTYHSSELFYPYLVIFGGQFIEDLDDIWTFNVETHVWEEIRVPEGCVRPCARRFHTSVKVQSTFYIIFGCHGKYKALDDIYSIDLSLYLQTQQTSSLVWQKHHLGGDKLDTFRWGHTSTVYNGRIYSFGGRNTSDYSNVIVYDIEEEYASVLEVKGSIPKARRKASSSFIGNSLFIFGGFNIQYFNDAYYLDFKEQKTKQSKFNSTVEEDAVLQKMKKMPQLDLTLVHTSQGSEQMIVIGLLIDKFTNAANLFALLQDIDRNYSSAELKNVIGTISRGYGSISEHLVYQYGLTTYNSKDEMILSYQSRYPDYSSKGHFFNRAQNLIIEFEEDDYAIYQKNRQNDLFYYDCELIMGREISMRVNRALLASKSKYFMYLFTSTQTCSDVRLEVEEIGLFEIILHYLNYDCIVVRSQMAHGFWFSLIEMAQYYCVDGLISLCSEKIMSLVTDFNCHELLELSLQLNLGEIACKCSEAIVLFNVASLKQLLSFYQSSKVLQLRQIKKGSYLRAAFDRLKFKVYQRSMINDHKSLANNQNTENKQNFL